MLLAALNNADVVFAMDGEPILPFGDIEIEAAVTVFLVLAFKLALKVLVFLPL